MSQQNDYLRILNKIQEGTITPEEGAEMLLTLDGRKQNGQSRRSQPDGTNMPTRWLRVIIKDMITNHDKINIRLPANVIEAGVKMGACFDGNSASRDIRVVLQAIEQGTKGKVLEKTSENSSEHIVISLE